MGNYLIAKYNEHLKLFQAKIKERLPGKLQPGNYNINKKRAVAYMVPWVRKSFQEGVRCAKVDAESKTGQKIERDFSIDQKIKEKLFLEYIFKIRAAGASYRTDIENYQGLKKLHPGRVKRNDVQVEQIYQKYVNAILAASNNLVLNAGAAGSLEVYKEIK